MLKTERGSTRSHSGENWLWKWAIVRQTTWLWLPCDFLYIFLHLTRISLHFSISLSTLTYVFSYFLMFPVPSLPCIFFYTSLCSFLYLPIVYICAHPNDYIVLHFTLFPYLLSSVFPYKALYFKSFRLMQCIYSNHHHHHHHHHHHQHHHHHHHHHHHLVCLMRGPYPNLRKPVLQRVWSVLPLSVSSKGKDKAIPSPFLKISL